MTNTGILALPLAAVIAIASNSLVVAQVTSGTIGGTVTDASGVVPGATVTVREVNKGTTSTYVTDATGNYTASFLVPGTYAVEVNVRNTVRRAVAPRRRPPAVQRHGRIPSSRKASPSCRMLQASAWSSM